MYFSCRLQSLCIIFYISHYILLFKTQKEPCVLKSVVKHVVSLSTTGTPRVTITLSPLQHTFSTPFVLGGISYQCISLGVECCRGESLMNTLWKVVYFFLSVCLSVYGRIEQKTFQQVWVIRDHWLLCRSMRRTLIAPKVFWKFHRSLKKQKTKQQLFLTFIKQNYITIFIM